MFPFHAHIGAIKLSLKLTNNGVVIFWQYFESRQQRKLFSCFHVSFVLYNKFCLFRIVFGAETLAHLLRGALWTATQVNRGDGNLPGDVQDKAGD